MSWEKIENHLFDRYCVEGEDKELDTLMKEHDKEIKNKVIDKFARYMAEYIDEKGIEELLNTPYIKMNEIAEELKEKLDSEEYDMEEYDERE